MILFQKNFRRISPYLLHLGRKITRTGEELKKEIYLEGESPEK
jgi:hypothetical protein